MLTTPGLSVIIDAIKESRRIFQRMNSYAIYRIAETLRVLFFARIQTLMYLKLSVAGHLTIFLTRTRGPFWSIRPAKILWIAVLGAQIVATLIAV